MKDVPAGGVPVSSATVREAAAILRAGGLVAFPTETVYGLGARALDPEAVARVYRAKGRPTGHPLIVHVLGRDDARALARTWTEGADRLAAAFWPGPLTLVLERGDAVPLAVTGGGDSVALRAPSHPLARELIAAAGPLAAPSANRYQSLSATTAAHVVKSLGGAVDLVLDGGAAWAGIESTVIDARGPVLRLLRHGAIAVASIRALGMDLALAVAPAVTISANDTTARVHESPGQDAKHYAPRADLVIVEGAAAALANARAGAASRRTALITRDTSLSPDHAPELAALVVLPDDAPAFARALFATLHRLDDLGVERIVVAAVPGEETWAAVADRLARGSSR